MESAIVVLAYAVRMIDDSRVAISITTSSNDAPTLEWCCDTTTIDCIHLPPPEYLQ